jgi:hypothetical protein
VVLSMSIGRCAVDHPVQSGALRNFYCPRAQALNKYTIYIHTHTHMLFITLGDAPIDPSPRPVNQPSDPAEPTPRAHSLPTEWIGSASQPRVGWRPRSPACPRQRRSAPCAKNEPTRPDRAATPRTHMTQPFFVVDQSFYYIVSHFTIMNSVILLE